MSQSNWNRRTLSTSPSVTPLSPETPPLVTSHNNINAFSRTSKNMTCVSQPKRIQRSTMMATALLAIVLITTQQVTVNAFSLSMVATGSFGTRGMRVPAPSVAPGGVTSSLISTLAEGALKRRLRAQTGVACDVTANSSDMLFKGKVGPVTVKGKGWQSSLGLTCRALEATVDTCELDMGRVLSSQKLVLTTPGKLPILLYCLYICC